MNDSENPVNENQDITLAGSWVFLNTALSKTRTSSWIVIQMNFYQLHIHMLIGTVTQILE